MVMRFPLDKPAGSHGFVRATPRGHFAFEDGKPVRFLGVGLNDKACFPSHELADRMADRFASLGWNMVRFHFGEWPGEVPWQEDDYDPKNPQGDTRHMDLERLDRLDYFIAALKKRGVYSCILLLQCVRNFHEGDGVDGTNIGSEGSQSTAHASQYFFPRMMELNREYFKNLLARKNPYTGLTLAEDPAVALYELVDENTLFFSFGGEKAAPHGPPGEMLLEMYRHFLAKGDTGKGEAVLPTMEGLNSGSPEARQANLFYYQVQTEFLRDTVAYLRSLGTRAPVRGNFCTERSPLANAKSCVDGLDYTDIHRYFNSEHEENAGPEVAMVKAPFLLTGGDNPMRSMTGGRFKGKPLTLGEWNFNAHGNCFFEGQALMGALGAYHGWDALCQWGWTDEINDFGSYVDYSDLTQSKKRSPLSMADRPSNLNQVPLMALLYLRGDVAPCEAEVVSPLSESEVFNPPCPEGERFGGSYPHLPDPLPYAVSYARAFHGDATPTKSYEGLVGDGQIHSLNNAWSWDYAKGLFTVNTEKSQVVMGFLGGQAVGLRDLRVKCETPFAVLAAQSLSGDPISTSHRLLITHVAGEKGYGAKLQIGEVEGEVQVRTGMKNPKAYELDLHGNRRGEIASRMEDGWLVFRLSPRQPSLNTEVCEAGR